MFFQTSSVVRLSFCCNLLFVVLTQRPCYFASPDHSGFAFVRNFFDTWQMPVKNNPLTPFIKGDFLKSPLEKGDSGGCLVCYDTNFEFPEH